MTTWPDPEIDAVESRADLARYLTVLAQRLRAGEIATENASTEAFIEAAGAWTGDMDGYFANLLAEPVPDKPDWATVAAIFSAALVYE